MWVGGSPPTQLCRAASSRLLPTADLDSPHLGPAFDVGPRELVRVLGLELVIERLWVVIVDQYERAADIELVDQVENLLVTLRRHQAADIDLGVVVHSFILFSLLEFCAMRVTPIVQMHL